MALAGLYFAWVNPVTAFDPLIHNVEDEQIVSMSIEHQEGDFAIMTLRIKNPRIGLLNAGRKLWAWMSCLLDGSVVPLFFGRVVGIPSDFNKEIVTIVFLAKPTNYAQRKDILAASLRYLPYYDPIFIRDELVSDPDVVLEGRTEAWHIDRTTHDVTTSDLIVGDETIVFTQGEIPYQSVDQRLDQPPVRTVRVTAEVPWTQEVAGSGLTLLNNFIVNTRAGRGLINEWPEAGANLSGGWNASEASAKSPYTDLQDTDWALWWYNNVFNPAPFAVNVIASYSSSISSTGPTQQTTRFAIINDKVTLNLKLGYAASRQRKDIVVFDLVADSQPVVTEPDDGEVLELSVPGNDVGLPVGADTDYPEIPIGDVQRRSYFSSDRGMQSLQYLIQLARARIVLRSRAIKIKFVVPFGRALEISLRKNASISDPRIPGGGAVGKIAGYSINVEGGRAWCEVTIACAIGMGGAHVEVRGTPAYVAEDVLEDGVQYMHDARVILGASDVNFEPLLANPNDDGLVFPLTSLPIILQPVVVTTETVELAPVQPTVQTSMQVDDCGNTTSASVNSNLDTSPYTAWLGGIETTVDFSLKSVSGGPFETTYTLNVSDLKLPKQIDLGAPSNG